MEPITVQTLVAAPLDRVWKAFTDPEVVRIWNAASPDWHTPRVENDLRDGGTFSYRMEARDGSEGFDFTGTYTKVVPQERIAYVMDDGRKVEVVFAEGNGGVRVTETFDPETVNPPEMQREGWQSILDNFRSHVEETV